MNQIAPKQGEIVDVIQQRFPSGEVRIPSLVTWVAEDGRSFNVKAMFGEAFDEAGHVMMALPVSEGGRKWRR